MHLSKLRPIQPKPLTGHSQSSPSSRNYTSGNAIHGGTLQAHGKFMQKSKRIAVSPGLSNSKKTGELAMNSSPGSTQVLVMKTQHGPKVINQETKKTMKKSVSNSDLQDTESSNVQNPKPQPITSNSKVLIKKRPYHSPDQTLKAGIVSQGTKPPTVHVDINKKKTTPWVDFL